MMYKLMYKRSEIMTLIDTRNTVPEGVETHPQQTPQSANSQQVVSDVSEILNFFCLAGFGIPSKDPPRVVKSLVDFTVCVAMH